MNSAVGRTQAGLEGYKQSWIGEPGGHEWERPWSGFQGRAAAASNAAPRMSAATRAAANLTAANLATTGF